MRQSSPDGLTLDGSAADAAVGAIKPLATLQDALFEAQVRRIHELEQRLAERTRVLTGAAQALNSEIHRRELAQVALFQAQKLEAMGHLAGGLAHDLRNVLGVMALGYQIIRRKSDDPAIQKVADNGSNALKQAHALVENMLGFMRRSKQPAEVVTAALWLPQMEELLGYAAGSMNTCRLQCAPDTWPVRVEEHRLGSALINLVVNARDAMPEGGEIKLTVRNLPSGAPRPESVPDKDFVVFSLSDTGCGMTPEVLAKATDPLFSTKGPGEGTGLGLAMVKGFAKTFAGSLYIASTPGEGTRVDIYLPPCTGIDAATPTDGDDASLPPGLAVPASPCLGDILLVDDDDLLRPAIAAMLRESAYRVTEASSAEVALALLPTVPKLLLVVTDVELPGAKGAALVQRLGLERPGLPALFISGCDLPASPLDGIPIMKKPFSREQLEVAVQKRLRQPRTSRAAGSLDRLIVRLRSKDLLAALLAWNEARGERFLPTLESLDGIVPPLASYHFIATREGADDDPAFRFRSVGAALA